MTGTSKYYLMEEKPKPPKKDHLVTLDTKAKSNQTEKSRQKTNNNRLDKKIVKENNKTSDRIQDNRWGKIRLLPN
jgi:hypothetical protein